MGKRALYLAARYERRLEIQRYALLLKHWGVTVTSRWLFQEQTQEEGCIVDLEDVLAADTLLFFSEDPTGGWPRGGRHVEFGIAVAAKKQIIIIGQKENIFHNLPGITFYRGFYYYLRTIQ